MWFGVYERAFVFDHRKGEFEGEPPGAPINETSGDIRALGLAMSDGEHASRVKAIHDYIRAGDTYQVNLTTKIELEYSGAPTAIF